MTTSAPVSASYTDSADRHSAFAWGDQDAPLGTWAPPGERSRVSRIHLAFDIAAYGGTRIVGANLYLHQSSAADCAKRAVEVWQTDTVTEAPTWATAPEREQRLDGVSGGGWCQSYLVFDVSSAVAEAVRRGKTAITLEVAVPEQFERDPSYGRTLDGHHNARLTVRHNQPPTIVAQHRYNGGVACAESAPYPRLGGRGFFLEALPADPDPDDQHPQTLAVEFEVWPQDDPSSRILVRSNYSSTSLVARVVLQAATLTDGRTYSWQARVDDGADLSPWSTPCHFVADTVSPAAPVVTSANVPPEEDAPAGEPGVFTFAATGPDTVGFDYTWREPSVGGCSYGGEFGRLKCSDPFESVRSVRADVPGGTATVRLNPPFDGFLRLKVRSIDASGRTSRATEYEYYLSGAYPVVTVVGPEPAWGEDVTLTFAPDPQITSRTLDFVYERNGTHVVEAGPDGTASITFRADTVNGVGVTVRSRSENGLVSQETSWSVTFPPWPGVRSDVYTESGEPTGGVGVPGTFTFTPPPGWTEIRGYRYSFAGREPAEVAAGPDGRASVTFTPSTSGVTDLEVYAVRPDGQLSAYRNNFSFTVA